MSRFASKHVTVYAEDYSGAASVELGPGPGDISIDNLVENNRETASVRDRGALEGRVYTNEVEQSVSITVELRNQSLVHATQARVMNMLLKKGSFSNAQTTDPGGLVYAVRVRVRLQDEAGNTDWIELPSVRFNGSAAMATEGGTITLSGSNLGAPKIGTAEVYP